VEKQEAPISDELREVQRIELENLQTVIEICKKIGLRYYLVGGSCLGALRHKGFIPWDDDIDIGMPRPDYDKFWDVAKEKMPDFMHLEKLAGSYRIENDKRKVLMPSLGGGEVRGIWLDIFPIDGAPSSKLGRIFHFFDVSIHRAFYKFTQIEHVSIDVEGMQFYKKALIRFAALTHIGKLLSPEKTLRKLDLSMQRYDYDNSKYVGISSGRYGMREFVPKSHLGGERTILFEGIEVNVPECAYGYLASIYGDWEKLPPVEKRVAHPIKFVLQ